MSGYLELCTLGDLLVRGSERHPERDALVLPGVRRSYRPMSSTKVQTFRLREQLEAELEARRMP